MYVPTMTLGEAVAEAKADLLAVRRKLSSVIAAQERAHRKDRRGGDKVDQRGYTSPGNNHWLCVTTTNKKHTLQTFMMPINAKEGFFGVQPASEGMSFVFTPHFLSRYRERSGFGAVSAIDNLTAFFYRNPSTTAMRTGHHHLGFEAFIGAVPDGYVLGTLHEDGGYHLCRTFVSHALAFPEQEKQWEGLAALYALQLRHPKLFKQLQG